jgi:hypothetical protein
LKYGGLNIASHLLITLAAFKQKNNLNGFWSFNQTLFTRLILGAFYSGILLAGILGALVAVDELFHYNIDDKIYQYVCAFVLIIFNTLFFLAGIPNNTQGLQQSSVYPKGLKVFTQYLLIPLVLLYLLILYVYSAKTLFEWDLPKGWVSNLILAFSSLGIFCLLLLYPLQSSKENRWINILSKSFYFAILPLIVFLWVAIGVRVNQYGITEARYYIIVLAAWLAIVAIYFIFSKGKNIKVIPASLFVLCVVASVGPLSAFQISKWSQLNRLEVLLVKNNMLKDGKIVHTKAEVPYQDNVDIHDIIDYIVYHHDIKDLQPFFTTNLESLNKDGNRFLSSESIHDLINVGKVGVQVVDVVDYNRNFSSNPRHSVNIRGYDYAVSFSFESYNDEGLVAQMEELDLEVFFNKEKEFFIVKGSEEMTISIEKLKQNLLHLKLNYSDTIPEQKLSLLVKGKKYDWKFIIRNIRFFNNEDKAWNVEGVSGYVLVKKK